MNKPEFRKDLVSGDWILVAAASRGKRPRKEGIKKCPFEEPQKSGNPIPLLWYPSPDADVSKMEDFESWFLQVIPNKYPLLLRKQECPAEKEKGFEKRLAAVGYHEVIITRDHDKTIAEMSLEEVMIVLKSYKERYRVLAKDDCVKYILIFHNHGDAAGASLAHPHSQLVALPVIDPDVKKSLEGSEDFFSKYKKCVHCVMLEQELKDKARIVDKNEHFLMVVPFAPRVSYETRIYPLKHESHFEDLDKHLFPALASMLKGALMRINKALDSPAYNFFIHTAPVNDGTAGHYHWHIEILPRGFSWAGLELGCGIEAVAVAPELAAENLRKAH